MRYLTDRKRAVGLGSAKSGVHHFWAMKMSSVAPSDPGAALRLYNRPDAGRPA